MMKLLRVAAAALAVIAVLYVPGVNGDAQPHVVGTSYPDRPNQASVVAKDTEEFRDNARFPRYAPLHSNPVTVDRHDWYINGMFIFLAFAALLCLPGTHAWPTTGHHKFKWESFFMFTITLWFIFTGWVITAGNFQHYWMVGKQEIHTVYSAYSPSVINAEIGMKVSLRGFNITLLGRPIYQNITSTGTNGAQLTRLERIDYNEYISWAGKHPATASQTTAWQQGRFGLGVYGSNVAQNFRRWQHRGTPIPIQLVAELIALDGEGVRWGRWFRIAGWYTHIMMYFCIPVWLFTIFYYFFAPWWGALLHFFLGLCMMIAVILYHNITGLQLTGSLQFNVPFEAKAPPHHAVFLRPEYGYTLHLVASCAGMNIFFAAIALWGVTNGMFDSLIDHVGCYEHPIETDYEGEADDTIESNANKSVFGKFMDVVKGRNLIKRRHKATGTPKSKAGTAVDVDKFTLSDSSETPFGEPIFDGEKNANAWLENDASPGEFIVFTDIGDLFLLVNAVVNQRGRADRCVARQFPIYLTEGKFNFHSHNEDDTAKKTIEAAVRQFVESHPQFGVTGPWQSEPSGSPPKMDVLSTPMSPAGGSAMSARTAAMVAEQAVSPAGNRFSLV